MRFLVAAQFLPDPNSGSAGSVLAVGQALAARGHTVDYEWLQPNRGLLRHSALHRHFEMPVQQLRALASRLSAAQYDVVVVSQPYAYLAYELLPALHPRTLFLNRTHGWEHRLLKAEQRLGYEPPRPLGRRVLSGASSVVTVMECWRTARAAHGLIAPSSKCANFIRETYDLPESKVAFIGYGLDTDFLEWRRVEPTVRQPRLLFVGNYLARKGTRLMEEVLPRVAKRFPGVALSLVVQPEAVSEVERLYRPAFGEQLRVHRWMPRAELREFYSAHEVLLFPSLFEGFGKTWLEGMACGLCVVGFDEGGLGDLAENGREALFCEPGDAAGWERLLIEALQNPERVAEIRRSAQERARQRTWNETAKDTELFCERLRGERLRY
ncbi:glycosyltransferase family 4 protein [Hyalangium versicolor]|uniref:glycosyltransferase family 4 protein n=1 Tax=Hyalangium versicolor TaxID=2861190 RepID=UPI001CCFD29E|nr:glycosyltransferase family 4 protein [Hyalangium versicolor]